MDSCGIINRIDLFLSPSLLFSHDDEGCRMKDQLYFNFQVIALPFRSYSYAVFMQGAVSGLLHLPCEKIDYRALSASTTKDLEKW